MKWVISATAALVPLCVTIALAQYEWPPRSTANTTGFFKVRAANGTLIDCPPEGKGSHIDPYLNRLKNRDLPSSSPAAAMTLTDVFGISAPDAMAMISSSPKKDRPEWSEAARSQVRPWEEKFASIEGYLVSADDMGPESCNCGSPLDVDRHISLAPFPKNAIPSQFPVLRNLYNSTSNKSSFSLKHHSMVVETSPRLASKHPAWTTSRLRQLVSAGVRVRVTGWLMFDQEHKSNLHTGALDQKQPPYKTRRTLWEIHPIHEIEYFKNGAWVDLDENP